MSCRVPCLYDLVYIREAGIWKVCFLHMPCQIFLRVSSLYSLRMLLLALVTYLKERDLCLHAVAGLP